jgi:hypothetical protein
VCLFVIILYSAACGYDIHIPNNPSHSNENTKWKQSKVVSPLRYPLPLQTHHFQLQLTPPQDSMYQGAKTDKDLQFVFKQQSPTGQRTYNWSTQPHAPHSPRPHHNSTYHLHRSAPVICSYLVSTSVVGSWELEWCGCRRCNPLFQLARTPLFKSCTTYWEFVLRRWIG